MDPPPLTQEEVWALADEIRSRYWPENTFPVDTEAIVEFRLHLGTEPCHSLLYETGLLAFLKRDLKGVAVDHDSYMDEELLPSMGFSFAHEIGHHFIHRDLYSKLSHRCSREWKDFILNLPEEGYRTFEWQADEFANRLLSPHPPTIS